MIMLKTIPLRLEVLTPVHIWSGETLIRNVDFRIDTNKRKILYMKPKVSIDMRKLREKSVEEALREVDRRLEFEVFLELDLTTKDQQYLNAVNEIYPCMKMGNTWYIPASSLKDSIRTAMVFNLIGKTSTEADMRKNVLFLLSKVRNERDLKNIALKSIEKSIFKMEIGRHIADVFSNLIIWEVPEECSSNVAIRDIRIMKVTDGELVARPLIESIEKNSSFRFELKIRRIHSQTLRYMPQNRVKFAGRGEEIISKENIAESLKVFSEYLLTLEIETIRSCIDTFRDLGIELDFYLQQLIKWRNDLGKDKRYYLRLGRYCGYKSKSVVDAFTPSIYTDVRNIMAKFYRNWDLSTIKITEVDGKIVGMGWVSIFLG